VAEPISDNALDQIFRDARTLGQWQDRPVSDETIRQLVGIANLGPTSANCQPARFVFVKSAEAKKRLEPHLSAGNREKTMNAPACAIIAYDMKFYENMPKTFPHNRDAVNWFKGDEAKTEENAFRNGSLQGAYLIIAARALGLDAGPMSGFDKAGVDGAFFPDGQIKSNFLCNLGYGDRSELMPRLPRLEFEESADIL